MLPSFAVGANAISKPRGPWPVLTKEVMGDGGEYSGICFKRKDWGFQSSMENKIDSDQETL